MNIVLLGGPGAGKGTQAVCLAKEFGLCHVSTGEYFRKIMEQKTELGVIADGYIAKGFLVPDDIVVKIAADRLALPDCRNGFILDGFPRTLTQAVELKKLYKIDACINIEVEPQELLKRILGRRICKDCGRSFHTSMYNDTACSHCGSILSRRDDDYEATVQARLSVYAETTKQIIEFYQREEILASVDGSQTVEDVFADIKAAVKKLTNI